MLTVHYIPQQSDPFSTDKEVELNRSSRVGEVRSSYAKGYCTITYQGPEGFWNPLDDCDNGDSGIWVFARVTGPDIFTEGEILNFTSVRADDCGNPFGAAAVLKAQAYQMTFWILQNENDYYLAIDDRMFSTHNRRLICFVNEEGSTMPEPSAAGEEKPVRLRPEPAAEKRPVCDAPVRTEPLHKVTVEEPQPQIDALTHPAFLYCRMCGRKIPGDSRFCMFCGVEVKMI